MITSIFMAESFLGFDYNEDKKWAPGRAFKGGPQAWIKFPDGTRIDYPNTWACVIDIAACMNIIARLDGTLNHIEAANMVHLHELSHACTDGDTKRYDKKNYTHTYYWNKTLIPISKMDAEKNAVEYL